MKTLFASSEERFQRIAEVLGSLRAEVASLSAQPAGSGIGGGNTKAFFDELGHMNAKADALSARIASNDELFNAILLQLKQTNEKTNSDYKEAFAGVEGRISSIRTDLESIAAHIADKSTLSASAQKELEMRIGSVERGALKRNDIDAFNGRLKAAEAFKARLDDFEAKLGSFASVLADSNLGAQPGYLQEQAGLVDGLKERVEVMAAETWRKLNELEQSTAEIRLSICELTKSRANTGVEGQQAVPQIPESPQTIEPSKSGCSELQTSKSPPDGLPKGD